MKLFRSDFFLIVNGLNYNIDTLPNNIKEIFSWVPDEISLHGDLVGEGSLLYASLDEAKEHIPYDGIIAQRIAEYDLSDADALTLIIEKWLPNPIPIAIRFFIWNEPAMSMLEVKPILNEDVSG